MKNLTASHLNYYLLCHRKLWLFHRQITMEQDSDHVAMGVFLDEQTYRRRPKKWKQLSVGPVKIDHFDAQDKVVREVKKSPKLEHVHVAQLKYYIFLLEQEGITGVTGRLEYPRQRKGLDIVLTDTDRNVLIPGWMEEVTRIANLEEAPELVRKSYCTNCAFYDFCFV